MITRRIYNPKPQTILLAAIKVDKKKVYNLVQISMAICFLSTLIWFKLKCLGNMILYHKNMNTTFAAF